MSTNIYNSDYYPIPEVLESILKLLIEYNSISVNDLKKLCLIIYNLQIAKELDKLINNLIVNILFHITDETNVYMAPKETLPANKSFAIINYLTNKKIRNILYED